MPALILAALLQIADVQPTAIVHASADDCAIMVLAGKEKLGWGAQKPPYPFSSEGHKNYVEDCSWGDFGIVPPVERVISMYAAPSAFSNIGRPIYDPSGLFASVNVSVKNASGLPSLAGWDCYVFKYGSQWRVSDCIAMDCTSGPLPACSSHPRPTTGAGP